MAQMKVFSEHPASDHFDRLVCDSGSPTVRCEHCGRVHYDSNGEHMERGELAGLEEKARENPDKYIGCDGTVHWGTVWDIPAVINCPCNFLGWYERRIWHDRKLISKYLIERSTAVLEEAKTTKDLTSKTDIVEKT